ncbi:ADC synthase [Collybia nuda]|uniref:aminodeoxychorismate synthase n=1 Tax=Collybia nuda TaxID=64659 RepID=A0A9P5YJR5_9AGAR|nr:ADC synthase [Collybia nuda]
MNCKAKPKTATIEPPRLLLIDSYDSFTFNLASLCRQAIPSCIIHIIKNDDYTIRELQPYLGYFSAIIVGPGPGSPDNPQDIGIVKDLWKIEEGHVLPIFGVCLGLQSMGIEFGAQLQQLRVVKHGQISHIEHTGTDLFHGIGKVDAVRYHSLHVVLPENGELQPLAWADDGIENGRVIMATKHTKRPFWSVQYHPESVRTEGGGADVVRNFWNLAQRWTRESGRSIRSWDSVVDRVAGNPWPHLQSHSPPPTPSPYQSNVITAILDSPNLSIIAVCEMLGVLIESNPFVLLDSAAQPGRFSIIGALMPESIQITYSVGDSFIVIKRGQASTRESLGTHDIWSWLAGFMRAHKFRGHEEIPFWGGFIGQINYELGVHSLQVPLRENSKNRHPDLNFVFVERSIVLDSITGRLYIQSIIPHDDSWVAETKTRLTTLPQRVSPVVEYEQPTEPPIITFPSKERYVSRINEAKEHLFAGRSYELCLTAHTHISIPKSSDYIPSSWERYKLLRQNNPAPHSAYLRLQPTTLLSSSPERFLAFSRPPGVICQLRPIKGTVRKAPDITRSVAEELLAGSVKEVAENLMIVDLIRHDLHGVVGDDVQVKKFCNVEEYETVWQLVSVIEGKLPRGTSASLDPESEVGWNVLKRSLPPGIMTGAPKKRSVEILQTLEDHNRSVYSGVFGYWCVSGSGDWSVTIRSCFKYDQRDVSLDQCSAEEWTIGAGGAITALSNAEAEWDEMLIKLQSVLRIFRAAPSTLK